MNPLDAVQHLTREARTAEPCATCGSRVSGLCHQLDAVALDDLSADSQRSRLPAKSLLFREGDPATRAFSIIEGVVKLSRLLPDGKQQVVGFRFSGDILGYGAGRTYPFDAELLTAGQFCRIERPRLDSLLRMDFANGDVGSRMQMHPRILHGQCFLAKPRIRHKPRKLTVCQVLAVRALFEVRNQINGGKSQKHLKHSQMLKVLLGRFEGSAGVLHGDV